ncbi:MAG: beta-hydroxyacyl-ACP dehydratase [Burkholderiales bacterium]|nr:beta-hydroxyacyl-ACP dehydratase [Phycisphaerae bacterium]
MTDAVDRGLLDEIKTILRRDLKLGPAVDVPDDMPLVGGEMDLDSLDILLLVSSIEKHFAIKIPSEAVGRWVFQDVSTLAKYVADNRHTLQAASSIATPSAGDWLSRLPHGPEFRFITNVTEVLPGQSASGVWRVEGGESFFKGHFPGNPIVPGVLLIEAMAQLAGLASADTAARSGKLVQVDVRFDQPIVPPAQIALTATVIKSIGPLMQCDVTASVGDIVAARGTITLHVA